LSARRSSREPGGGIGETLRASVEPHDSPQPKNPASLRRNEVIDHTIVLWFPAPQSATGEDVAEFHVHGGRAILEAVFAALGAVPGLRPAGPGEFTRRAVENGKLDLTRAEALADLIDAETQAQRRQALDQFEGRLLALCDGWRQRLIRLSAWAEAAIDFGEEELDTNLDAQVTSGIRELRDEILRALADSRRGEITREGLHLTVVGPPNAGKSSLLNALARRDIAIVSDMPGTTRDILEARLDLDGYLVTVADTAGLREAGDAIEAEGVRRALARAAAADIVLLLLDGTAETPPLPPLAGEVLTVWNKCDVPWPQLREGLKISARTGEGLATLMETLAAMVRNRIEGAAEAPVITRARHRRALEEVEEALSRALDAESPELVAEDLRLALRTLGRLVGRVDIEELLDVIFRDFCIGK
jgi:tRNA modification GTPase